MRAAFMTAVNEVEVREDAEEPSLDPRGAVLRVEACGICGSDLWPYASMERSETGQSMGHEAIGIVDAGAVDVIRSSPRVKPSTKLSVRVCPVQRVVTLKLSSARLASASIPSTISLRAVRSIPFTTWFFTVSSILLLLGLGFSGKQGGGVRNPGGRFG